MTTCLSIRNRFFKAKGPKCHQISLGSCCYKQLFFVMSDKVDDGCNRTENGYSQNQASSSFKPRRRASQGAERTWATLGHRKAPRGDPGAGASTRWSTSSNAKKHCRRTSSTICDSARKDLESLAVHMPNLPDTDAKTLALRMSPLGAFLCPSVAQVRSAPCDAVSSSMILGHNKK